MTETNGKLSERLNRNENNFLGSKHKLFLKNKNQTKKTDILEDKKLMKLLFYNNFDLFVQSICCQDNCFFFLV